MLQQLLNNLIYRDLEVIGQSADNKYILCFYRKGHSILAFDQHAVHERIKFENLFTTLFNPDSGQMNTKELKNPIKIKMNMLSTDRFLNIISKGTSSLDNYLDLIVSKSGLTLHLPKFTRRYSGQPDTILVKTIPCIMDLTDIEQKPELIPDIIDDIHECSDLDNSTMSAKLYEYIQSRACRGAIRFGQKLERSDCRLLMEQLLRCSVPFFCAHKRPNVSIIPLLNILDDDSRERNTINYNRNCIEYNCV